MSRTGLKHVARISHRQRNNRRAYLRQFGRTGFGTLGLGRGAHAFRREMGRQCEAHALIAAMSPDEIAALRERLGA